MTGVVVHPYNPSTWVEEKQKDQMFEAILSYAASLRLVQGYVRGLRNSEKYKQSKILKKPFELYT